MSNVILVIVLDSSGHYGFQDDWESRQLSLELEDFKKVCRKTHSGQRQGSSLS